MKYTVGTYFNCFSMHYSSLFQYFYQSIIVPILYSWKFLNIFCILVIIIILQYNVQLQEYIISYKITYCTAEGLQVATCAKCIVALSGEPTHSTSLKCCATHASYW